MIGAVWSVKLPVCASINAGVLAPELLLAHFGGKGEGQRRVEDFPESKARRGGKPRTPGKRVRFPRSHTAISRPCISEWPLLTKSESDTRSSRRNRAARPGGRPQGVPLSRRAGRPSSPPSAAPTPADTDVQAIRTTFLEKPELQRDAPSHRRAPRRQLKALTRCTSSEHPTSIGRVHRPVGDPTTCAGRRDRSGGCWT